MDRKWGQHFLIDKNIARKIIRAANLEPGDTVLEIGPGRGVLTEEILSHQAKVIAVEIDNQLVQKLKQKFKNYIEENKLKVIACDFLKLDLAKFFAPYPVLKIVANIPYYITGRILRKIYNFKNWKRAVLLLQKEVAQRLKATPGTKEYGILSVATQVYTRVEIVGFASPKVFRPQPKVTSAIVRLERLPEPLIKPEEEKGFFHLLHIAFGQRRKILINNLSRSLNCSKVKLEKIFASSGLGANIRAENLSIADFVKLNRFL